MCLVFRLHIFKLTSFFLESFELATFLVLCACMCPIGLPALRLRRHLKAHIYFRPCLPITTAFLLFVTWPCIDVLLQFLIDSGNNNVDDNGEAKLTISCDGMGSLFFSMIIDL